MLRALALGLGLFAPGVAQAVTVVSSLSAFDTAIGGAATTTDPFDTDIAYAPSITFDSGAASTVAGGYLGLPDNRVDGGLFYTAVDGDGSIAPLSLTWSFPQPVLGFGADFMGVQIVDVTVDGGTTFFDLNTGMGGDDGFFGLVDTDAPFSTVTFSVQGSTFFDTFTADNLVFADVPGAVVPLPASLSLLLAALGGAALIRRRR